MPVAARRTGTRSELSRCGNEPGRELRWLSASRGSSSNALERTGGARRLAARIVRLRIKSDLVTDEPREGEIVHRSLPNSIYLTPSAFSWEFPMQPFHRRTR